MSRFSPEEFRRFILDHRIVGFLDQPITLKSGRTSYWYVNWRNAFADVHTLDRVTEYVLTFVLDLIEEGTIRAPRCFIGVPEGATKLGVLTQYKHAVRSREYAEGSHPFCMGRAKPKSHGIPTDRYFVGVPAGPTILLEDTTTTGGSLLDFLDQLIESGIDVVGCIGLTNRMERREDGTTVREAVEARQGTGGNPIPYFNLSSALDLLPAAARNAGLSIDIRRAVEEEFARYGTAPLSLSENR